MLISGILALQGGVDFNDKEPAAIASMVCGPCGRRWIALPASGVAWGGSRWLAIRASLFRFLAFAQLVIRKRPMSRVEIVLLVFLTMTVGLLVTARFCDEDWLIQTVGLQRPSGFSVAGAFACALVLAGRIFDRRRQSKSK